MQIVLYSLKIFLIVKFLYPFIIVICFKNKKKTKYGHKSMLFGAKKKSVNFKIEAV
jgi:hypothetical protein